MYRDNSLIPKEAIRLAALGTLARGPMSYADLSREVRQFAARIVGPSLDLLGTSIELLKFEGLIAPGDDDIEADLVLTDSVGIQDEAPSIGKPVFFMRDVTERPDAVAAGTVELVGASQERIVAGVSRLLDDDAHYSMMSRAHNPYGDGHACERIIQVLKTI